MGKFNNYLSKASCCLIIVALLGLILAPSARADVISFTTHGTDAYSLDGLISNTDLLAGLIATELPPLLGWHPANGDPADHLPAFTDGMGIRATGLTGLLNDFPGEGTPAKSIQYDLGSLMNIAEIKILSVTTDRMAVFSPQRLSRGLVMARFSICSVISSLIHREPLTILA